MKKAEPIVNNLNYFVSIEKQKSNLFYVVLPSTFYFVVSKLIKMSNEKSFKSIIEGVETFHNAFGIANNYEPTTALSLQEIELRHRLMKEENEEYLEAAKNNDIVEVADALGDQLYILCGTILKHGLQNKIVEVFEEIQRSNMSKLDKNGQPIYREDGKVMKSDLYFKPNLKPIVESHE